MDGWIKIHRQLLEWEWYDDTNVVRVFLHLLLSANFEQKRWKGITIERGQLVTSVANLANETHLTSKQIRIVLDKLKNTNEIDTQGASKYTLITICKYDTYQGLDNTEGQTKGEQRANKGQTEGNQRATTKEIKNIRTKEDIVDADKSATPKKTIDERKNEFGLKIKESGAVEKYGREMCLKFFNYWTEHGDSDKKMRFEKQKSFDIKLRLATWYERDKQYTMKLDGGERMNRNVDYWDK